MTRLIALRPVALLLCAAGALASFSALAFQQTGKITAGSDMTFFPYEYMENNKPWAAKRLILILVFLT